ncbi:MAG: hypothetical protein GF317_15590, partial [Candidatus Lokiarchaeota archaeon]|nr:hypothetical protein [Candidatus Lokiarchaeota archaeon]MBD3200986.1 hypothetical protein [Candidatus Lokiarchaeota archaeon]
MSKKGPERSIILPPLGLEILATNISDIAEVKIFDNLLYEGTLAEISKIISNFNPNYVGISCCYTFQISHAIKIARLAKEFDTTTVLGGWHPTLAPNETINYPSVDIIVHGEGELTFRALIKKQSPFGVKGLSYKQNGAVINNEKRELMDLTNMRITDRTLRSQNRKHYY